MIIFGFESYFFLMGTNLSLKVQSRMEDKVRIKNLKSLFAFFEKFGRVGQNQKLALRDISDIT